MNILFCNSSNVSEIKGGKERITARISKGLTDQGHHCFLAYKSEIDSSLPLTPFIDRVNVNKSSLENFILKNKIEVVIIQKMTRNVKLFYDIRERHHLDLRIISVLHFCPGYELKDMNYTKAWRILKKESKGWADYMKNTLRMVLYPIYMIFYPIRDKALYRTVYHFSDKVVLLSKAFIDEYADYCKLNDKTKFAVIPNALSYDAFLPVARIKEKKKQVLVVSRLADPPKRVYLAIQAWAEIEKDPSYDDWIFKIVGSGPAEISYKELVKKMGLLRIEFCGRQEPKSYYEESAVFLMTSSYEGWGLTLTEAQQFGCVPVAYDTFSSLKDIINNGENGYTVSDLDEECFIKTIKMLMKNEDLRITMAIKAVRDSKRFQLSEMIILWNNLLNS